MSKSFIYDVESIIKRSQVIEAKKDKIEQENMKNRMNNHVTILDFSNNINITHLGNENFRRLNRLNLVGDVSETDNTFEIPTNTDFNITESYKSIYRYKGDGTNKVGFRCSKNLVYVGIQEFSFIVNKSDNCNFYVGVMEEGTNLENGASDTITSWMCYLLDGRFINAGEKTQLFCDNWVKPDEDQITTVCIDTYSDEMYVKLNGIEFSDKLKLKMNINDIQKQKLVVCVDIKKVGDKISIY